MEEKLIFGYEWEDIQRAQEGGTLARRVQQNSKPIATDADKAMLVQYGSIDALKNAGMLGVVDRLINSGLSSH